MLPLAHVALIRNDQVGLLAFSDRTLPAGGFLRDHDLFALADHTTERGPGLCQGAAAADLLTWRERVLEGLRRRGVLTRDAFPGELTAVSRISKSRQDRCCD